MTTRGKWQANSDPAAGVVASAVQVAAPASNDVNRCQTLTVSCAGVTGVILAVLRDGATGVGDIIWSGLLNSAATSSAAIFLSGLDLRSSIGNALTLEFTSAPIGGGTCAASMAGDLVVSGQAD